MQVQVQMQRRKCDWGLAGISVVKREHEGRGAAGWVILFDPVRGLDESTRQRLCSSARLPEVLLSHPVSSVHACAPGALITSIVP